MTVILKVPANHRQSQCLVFSQNFLCICSAVSQQWDPLYLHPHQGWRRKTSEYKSKTNLFCYQALSVMSVHWCEKLASSILPKEFVSIDKTTGIIFLYVPVSNLHSEPKVLVSTSADNCLQITAFVSSAPVPQKWCAICSMCLRNCAIFCCFVNLWPILHPITAQKHTETL